MAEAIFNHLAQTDSAVSAGISPAEEIDAKIIKVLQEIGIKIKSSKPKLLTDSMLKDADVIISFGCLVPSLFPKEKFQEWLIEDPASLKEFRMARDEIAGKIKTLLANMQNNI
jgi:arsenate reductase